MKSILPPAINNFSSSVALQWEAFILEQDHPCLMAQAVFKSSNVIIREYEAMGSPANSSKLLQDINRFLETYDFRAEAYHSFVAVFDSSIEYSETEFEKLLWQELQALHAADQAHDWDPTVSADPEDDFFSFSVGGKAFYIVGMHPNSSRMARRSPQPALVFNLHLQFERLKEKGIYAHMQAKIRERDHGLQGSINPMLSNFGEGGEARQYSGREVGARWKCPFMAAKKT